MSEAISAEAAQTLTVPDLFSSLCSFLTTGERSECPAVRLDGETAMNAYRHHNR